jgi:hypothetical protein
VQILIQVLCSKGPSLRDAIAKDAKIAGHGLRVSEQQRPGRSPGWAKVHGLEPEVYGAINIQWEVEARMLVCRAIARSGMPSELIASFTGYLLSRHRRRIQSIAIVPR